MNTESEINAQFFPIINALSDKYEAAKAAAIAANFAFYCAKPTAPAKREAWTAYEAAELARQVAQAELNAAFDARTKAKKKLKAANRKAWFNS